MTVGVEVDVDDTVTVTVTIWMPVDWAEGVADNVEVEDATGEGDELPEGALVFTDGGTLLWAEGVIGVMVGRGTVVLLLLAGVRPPCAPVAEISESALA